MAAPPEHDQAVEIALIRADLEAMQEELKAVRKDLKDLLEAWNMPLLEVFISEFLRAVEHVVKRGLRSDYRAITSRGSRTYGANHCTCTAMCNTKTR